MKFISPALSRIAKVLFSIIFKTILLSSILLTAKLNVFSQDGNRAQSTQSVTELSMTSDAGDYIGGGQNYYYSNGVGTYALQASDFSGDGKVDFVQIQFNGTNQDWTLQFSSRLTGRNIVPGFYDNATRYPFESGTNPGLTISGNGRGCNQSIGSFTIHEAEFDYTSSPPRVNKFVATFEQHCEGMTPAFYGTIYYNYTPSTVAETYTISGQLTDYAGTPAPNVSVGLYGSQTKTTVTDNAGNYSFTGLPAEGNYRIAPTSLSYIINPTSILLRRLLGNQTANFTVVPLYSLGGRVVNEAGSPITGIVIRLMYTQNTATNEMTTTSDADGSYSFTNLRADGNYMVMPSQTYYTFNPGFRTFNNLTGDTTTDFVGTVSRYSISGKIIDNFGMGISGVRIELRGSDLITTTDADGNYSFENVLYAGVYGVTPISSVYNFSPNVQYIYSINKNYSNVIFSASISNTYLITGVALDTKGNPLGNVLMTISGSTPSSTLTDANGFYTFRNLPAGDNYTITAQKKGYLFTPSSKTVDTLAANSYVNFVGGQSGKRTRSF